MNVPVSTSRFRRNHKHRNRLRRGAPWVVGVVIAALGFAACTTGDAEEPNPEIGPSEADLPDVAALAGPLAEQDLEWEECDFNDDGPPLPGADLSNVECATIAVPRDWLDPDPDVTWDVRISHAVNIDPADEEYNTTILTHPGGPYSSGLSYASTVQMWTPELRPTTNYLSFDQRGLGQSSIAECDYTYDPNDGQHALPRAIGEACSTDPDVATMTTEQAAYDMDFIRHLLDLPSVTYMGYSYGTWLGTWYGALFWPNIDRMVLDSATDSTADSIQANYNAAHEGRDRQFRLHMLNWVARHDDIYGLGQDPEGIWEAYFDATSPEQHARAAYWAWSATGTTAAFSSAELYPRAGELIALIIAAGQDADGSQDASQIAADLIDGMGSLTDEEREAAHATLTGLAVEPEAGEDGLIAGTHSYVIEFTACTDGQWNQDLEFWEEFNQQAAAEAPLSAQFRLLDSAPTCAFWETDSAMPALPDTFPETIVLQSEMDSMTPYEQGFAAATGLPNTSLIAVDNENIHGVFPYGTEQVDAPVLEFLTGGDRPAETIVADALPMPMDPAVYESWSPIGEGAEPAMPAPQFTDPTAEAQAGEPRGDADPAG